MHGIDIKYGYRFPPKNLVSKRLIEVRSKEICVEILSSSSIEMFPVTYQEVTNIVYNHLQPSPFFIVKRDNIIRMNMPVLGIKT